MFSSYNRMQMSFYPTSQNVNFKMQNALKTICQQFSFQCGPMNEGDFFVCFQTLANKLRKNIATSSSLALLLSSSLLHGKQVAMVKVMSNKNGNLISHNSHYRQARAERKWVVCTVRSISMMIRQFAVENDLQTATIFAGMQLRKCDVDDSGHKGFHIPVAIQSTNLLWNIK